VEIEDDDPVESSIDDNEIEWDPRGFLDLIDERRRRWNEEHGNAS